MADDDLIFAEDAQSAMKETRLIKPRKRRTPETPPTARPRSRPPDAATAARPHVLVSPVLPDPLLLSRGQRYFVGRSERAQIRIKTDKVSRRHAQIYWDGRCFVVLDEGSTNGSLLNGRPLKPGKTVPLLGDDTLDFGGYEVKVEVLAPGAFPESDIGGPTRKMRRKP